MRDPPPVFWPLLQLQHQPHQPLPRTPDVVPAKKGKQGVLKNPLPPDAVHLSNYTLDDQPSDPNLMFQ